jgi:lipoprotein-releasing system permease protein
MADFPWVRFVAFRWFKAGRESGPSLGPAMAGIAVGVAALIIIIGVMNGFQMGFMDSVLELDSYHLRVDPSGQVGNVAIDAEDFPGIRTVMPFIDIRTIAMNDRGRAEPLRIKVTPDDAFILDTVLPEMLVLGSGSFGNGILLGSEFAQQLNVSVDDFISVLTVQVDPDEGVKAAPVSVRVSGVYHSGFYDFDAGLAFLPASSARGIAEGEFWMTGIKLDDRYDDARVKARLEATGIPSAAIESWRTYNRAFFGALRMEKSVMMMLVGLIFLVVGVNIFHALRKAVYARFEDIATLKSIGADSGSLRMVFLINGASAGLGGAAIGLAIGLLIALNINQVFALLEAAVAMVAVWIPGDTGSFSFFSPDFFYIADVPVRLPFLEVLFIFISGGASAMAAAWAASTRISSLKPSEVLRDE